MSEAEHVPRGASPRSGGPRALGLRGATQFRGRFYLAVGVLILLGFTGDVAGDGAAPLFRLLFGAILVTSGGSLLIPASGRSVVLGWALRVARVICYVVALAVLLVWLWPR